MNKAIEIFIEQYEREQEYFAALSREIHNQLENILRVGGIKGIVSSRFKSIDRLQEKLMKFDEIHHFKNEAEIRDKLIDLAAARVALYFPEDSKALQDAIRERFDVTNERHFPKDSRPSSHSYNRIFSGYKASHFHVNIKALSVPRDKTHLTRTTCEVQVASVLMHAWSEVEHDMVYKPLSGELYEEELMILDELNGIVLAGEIALNRLQKAYQRRIEQKETIDDQYELYTVLKSLDIDLNHANIKNLLSVANSLSPKEIKDFLSSKPEEEGRDKLEDITEYAFSNLAGFSSKDIIKYISHLNLPKESDESQFLGEFFKYWIELEKAVKAKLIKNDIHLSMYGIVRPEHLRQASFTEEQINKYADIRRHRNRIIHALEMPDSRRFKEMIDELKLFIESIH